MKKRCITSPCTSSPAAGPYSRAVAAGDLLFISGQGPFAKDGSGPISGSFADEVHLTLDNLKAVLDDAESSLDHVVKNTIFLQDMAQFGEFNEIYKSYFPSDPPARTCIQVAQLPLGIQVEIESIAILP